MRIFDRINSVVLSAAVLLCSVTCTYAANSDAKSLASSSATSPSLNAVNPVAVSTALFGATEGELSAYEYILNAVNEHHKDTGSDVGTSVTAIIPQSIDEGSLRKMSQTLLNNGGLYYWADEYSYNSRSDYSVVRFLSSPEYGSSSVRKNTDRQIYTEINECLALIQGLASDYDKIKTIHNWLCTNINYAYAENGDPSDETIHHTIVGVFTDEKSAVCEGYAKAFQLLMNLAGIECATIFGDISGSDIGHVWNIVKLDEKWYTVDCTWDSNGAALSYTNFLTGSISELNSGRIVKTDYAFQDSLPTLSESDYSAPSITRQEYTLTYSETTGIDVRAYNNGVYVPSGTEVEEGAEICFLPANNLSLKVNGYDISESSVVISGNTEVAATIGKPAYSSHRLAETGDLTVANDAVITDLLPQRCIIDTADGDSVWGSVSWQPVTAYTPDNAPQEISFIGTITCTNIEMPSTPITVTRRVFVKGEEYRLEFYEIPDGYNLRVTDENAKSYISGARVSHSQSLTITLENGLAGVAADFYVGTDAANMTLIASSAMEAEYTVSGGSTIYITALPSNNNLISVQPIAAWYEVKNGTDANPYSLGIPENAIIETAFGNIIAPLIWDLSNYIPSDITEHSVIINGNVVLPDSVKNPNSVSTGISCTLNIAAAEQLVAISEAIPTSVDIPAGSALTALSLGIPEKVTCLDSNGNSVAAEIRWSLSGGETQYTMTGTLIRNGYVYNAPLSVAVNIADGFVSIPEVQLSLADYSGNIVTAIEQRGVYSYILKTVIKPVVGHKNAVLKLAVPDGLTLTGLADASLLAEIDSIASAEENGKTVITVELSDDISTSGDIMFDINLKTNYNVSRLSTTTGFSSEVDYSHDFGFLYTMGEELPFALEYTAEEAEAGYSVQLEPQGTITVRDDYRLTCGSDGAFTVPTSSYNNSFLKDELENKTAEAKFAFFEAVDLPYFVTFKAIIPLPKQLEASVNNRFEGVFQASLNDSVLTVYCDNAEKLWLYRSGSHTGLYAYLQDSITVNEMGSATVDYGSVYTADNTIKYAFTDNFGNEYVIDTGKRYTVSSYKENPEYNVVLDVPYSSFTCLPMSSEYRDVYAHITNLRGEDETLSVREVDDFTIAIDIPDGVYPTNIAYIPCDTATACFADGTSRDFDMSDGEADIEFNDENNRIARIELRFSVFGETDTTCDLFIRIGGYLTHSDGSTISYGTYFEDELDNDCDFGVMRISCGNADFSLSTETFIGFVAAETTDNLKCTAQSNVYNAFDTPPAEPCVSYTVTNTEVNSGVVEHSGVITRLGIPETHGALNYSSFTADFYSKSGNTNAPDAIRLVYADGGELLINGGELDAYITLLGNTRRLKLPIEGDRSLSAVEICSQTLSANDTINAKLHYSYDIRKLVTAYGKTNQRFEFVASVESPNISLLNSLLVSRASVDVYTAVDAEVKLNIKSVSDVNMTVCTGVVQTDEQTVCAELYTTGTLNASGSLYQRLNKLAISELNLTVQTRTNNSDIVKDSFYIVDATGTTIYPTSVTAINNGYSVKFCDAVTDWSLGKKTSDFGALTKLYYKVKPMYYSVSGTYSTENIVATGTIKLAEEQPWIEQNINPDGTVTLVYKPVWSGSSTGGAVFINSAAATSIDNHGATDFDRGFDYGAYRCDMASDISYALCVTAAQDTELTDFTAYVAIPNKSCDTASIGGQSFQNSWNAALKGISANAPNASYKLFYTTDAPKSDNGEHYTEYLNSLGDEVLSKITKIKITAGQIYNGDKITFKLAYRDGFNTSDIHDSIYMSAEYSYINTRLAVKASGVTNAVRYSFEYLRVIYDANGGDGEAPIDNTIYTYGSEVTVKNHGKLSKKGFDFDGWTLNGEKVSSFVITDTVTLYAAWKKVTTPPVVTEPPIVTSPPIVTNPPIVTSPPIVTNPPIVTSPPVVTNPPIVTSPPIVTNQTVITASSITTAPPVITTLPDTSEIAETAETNKTTDAHSETASSALSNRNDEYKPSETEQHLNTPDEAASPEASSDSNPNTSHRIEAVMLIALLSGVVAIVTKRRKG